MDLTTLDLTAQADTGRTLDLVHPLTKDPLRDDNGAAITITLRGPWSRAWQQMLHERVDQDRHALLHPEAPRPSSAEEYNRTLDRLTALTVTWSGIAWHGATLDPTPENIRRVYDQFWWIRQQVDAFVADEEAFFGARSANSSTGTASGAGTSTPTAPSPADG